MWIVIGILAAVMLGSTAVLLAIGEGGNWPPVVGWALTGVAALGNLVNE